MVMRPVSMPMPSFRRTCTSGARQLVVQEALETMSCFVGIVLVVVHAHEEGLHLALAGRGDDDLLRARGEVALGLLGVREQARGLHDELHAEVLPGKLRGLLGGHDALGLMPVDDDDVILGGAGGLFRCQRALEPAVHGIVLQLVGEILGIGADIHHRHDVDLRAQEPLVHHGEEHLAPNAAEPVDPDLYCHIVSPSRICEMPCEIRGIPRCSEICGVPRSAKIRGIPRRTYESSSSLYTWSAVSAWMIALRFSLFLMMSVSFARMRR